MAQRLWFNDFPLTSDKFHSQYLPTFVFQSWTFAFWIKYLCPAWHITAPTIWVPNWVPYRCQQIKYCNSYGGERLLLLSRIGIFSPGWCWAPALTMGHWSHVRVVTAGAKSDEIIATIRVGPRPCQLGSLGGDQDYPRRGFRRSIISKWMNIAMIPLCLPCGQKNQTPPSKLNTQLFRIKRRTDLETLTHHAIILRLASAAEAQGQSTSTI